MRPLNNYVINSVRHFIEEKCLEVHRVLHANKQSIVSDCVMSLESPVVTGLCVESSACLLEILRSEDEKFKLEFGYMESTTFKPSNGLKKSYVKGKTEPEILHGWYWDYINDKAFGVHCWLESEKNIIDITSDQFGHQKIIICELNDPRYIRGDSFAAAEGYPNEPSVDERIKIGKDWARDFNNALEKKFVGIGLELSS